MKRLGTLLEGGLKMLEQERLLRLSPLFNAAWYVRTYPEVGTKANAVSHYLRAGAEKGYDPGPDFSTSAYLAANPDVREAGLNALVHFLRYGQAEGRGLVPSVDATATPLGSAAMARIAEAFDAAFYAATNPDLPGHAGSLDSFLATGWYELRDPCAWFSCEAYLRDHPDVAETGQNPFVHYLLWGCREGRKVRPSQRQQVKVSAQKDGRQRLVSVSMIRNESDIIRCFTSHLLALFDDIVFVDHMSEDGTFEWLEALAAENARIKLIRLEEPAYLQSVTMTHVVRDCAEVRTADWVFLLDADEFLPFSSREALETTLARYEACPVIDMRWRNLVPEAYWEGEISVDAATKFLVPAALSPFRKIAFQPGRVSLSRTVVAQGNHALIETLNGLDVPSFAADFPVLHIPVRSAEQLLLKLNQGVDSYRRMGRSRDAAHGTHWDSMLRATCAQSLTDDLLNAVAVRYSEEKPELEPISAKALLSRGHDRSGFDLAFSEQALPPLQRRPLGEMLMRIHGSAPAEDDLVDCPATTRLVTDGRILRRAPEDPSAEYPALDDIPTDGGDVGAIAAIGRLLAPSYQDITDLVPSAEAGHIPFLLALTEVLAPRRIVEIGTTHGASFLAFCQAVRRLGLEADAIAISSWAFSDPSERGDEVFETFKFLTRKYSDFVGVLRQDCKDAALRFADGSVDLLHLDGFCGDVPLRQMLEAWLPKLSSRGVLLLHDIHVHGGEFAVWRVWEDLSGAYPSLDFAHSEGLGVACVGANVPGELVTLCHVTRSDRAVRMMLQHHFESLGQTSAELFSRRYDMAQAEARMRAEAAQAEELSWLRQETESLRSDNAELRDLLKGKVAHAKVG